MDFWQTMITSALAAGSAILASHLTNKANLDRVDRQFNLDKTKEREKQILEMREEIYRAVYNWTGTTTSRHLGFVSMLHGRSNWEQYIEHIGSVKENPDLQVGVIEFRLKVHFPELIPKWDALMESFRSLSQLYIWYAAAKERGEEKELEMQEPAKAAIEGFIKATDSLKSAIIATSLPRPK